ncbi:serine hydrolase [Oceanospirillaceae bacterium ASx5O]|nr:serine hydrolase [Oceanospirillaceae bacterium ASx5O]
MKRPLRWLFSIIIALPLLLVTAAWAVLGYSPVYLYNAPSVATGIGAKLACSMRYVMAQNEQQAAADIKIYSPILALLDYQYDDEQHRVRASLAGYERTASWQEGIGCYLDYAGFTERQRLHWPQAEAVAADWPQGYQVNTIKPELQSKLAAMLAEDNTLGHDTRALLVVHKGQIVAEAYAPGYTERSLFLGWSMAKSITGLMIGQLEMQGKLEVTETGLFPQWQDGRSNISIEQLLHMTDGLAYDEIYDPGATAPAMLFQHPSAAAYMLSLPLRDEPGQHYRYSSGSTVLLNQLVQQRTAANNAAAVEHLAEHFFRPLGMQRMVYETDAAGLLMGSSYLYATARDWAKVGQLMLNGGEINGTRIVTEGWIQRALQPNGSDNKRDFGYQWWLNKATDKPRWPGLPDNVFAAQGNREQRVLVIPDQDLVIVRLGWSPGKYRDNENFVEIASWFR